MFQTAKTLCRICLRCDFDPNHYIEQELEDFHDELCDSDASVFCVQQAILKFCPLCECLLRKFYNFRQKCKRANALLKACKKQDLISLKPLPSTLGIGTVKNQKVLCLGPQFNNLNPDVSVLVKTIHSSAKDENALDMTNGDWDEKLILFVQDEDDVGEEIIIKDVADETDECNDDYVIKSEANNVKNVEKLRGETDSDEVIAKLRAEPDRTSIIKRVHSLELSDEDVKYAKKYKLISRKTLKHVARTLELKNKIIALLEQGMFQDLEGSVKLNKETFLDMFKKLNKARVKKVGLLNPDFSADMPRLKRFLQSLVKMFDPKYNETFDIQYMLTPEEKLAEFNGRRHSDRYLNAEYKCDICFKVFDGQALLDYHGIWHDSSRPAACDICGMRFMNKLSLTKHCNGDHYSVYRCKLCPLITWNFDAMANHYDYHSGVKHTCDICFMEFSHKSSLNTHRRTVHTHPTACPQCGRGFVSQHGVLHHVLRKHRDTPVVEAPVPCPSCACAFVSEDVMRAHVRFTHHKRRRPNKSTCLYPDCGLTFLTRVALREHKIQAGHEHPPETEDTQTENTQRLKRPITQSAQSPRKRGPNVSPPTYKTCPICQAEVRNWCPQALYLHHQEAHPGVPYPSSQRQNILCHLCGMAFHAPWSFREHMNSHSGARPFACACGARFPRRALLAQHAAARHRARAHCCRSCGKCFNTSSNLANHMRYHIGDRRYVCELCPKRFLHKGSLNEHVRGVHMHIRRVKKARTRV